jgi:hypothetical protein
MPLMPFDQYHKTNPHIYDLILKQCTIAWNTGYRHDSMRRIMQEIRWHINVTTKDPDGYKINHNYSPEYSRKIMNENPVFTGFFTVKKK